MNLQNLIPQSFRPHVIRHFGQATLYRLPNGRHQLVGGTGADRSAAIEWASLFAHEIVFTQIHHRRYARLQANRQSHSQTPAESDDIQTLVVPLAL